MIQAPQLPAQRVADMPGVGDVAADIVRTSKFVAASNYAQGQATAGAFNDVADVFKEIEAIADAKVREQNTTDMIRAKAMHDLAYLDLERETLGDI
ncbi:hypothetical protein [Methyloceanibacter sp.]|uniref:hypothetical protein n=1 Tax=Methyloceanibacter sp. TaxID=1965321 RepID=UPI002C5A8A15|nr:hypothetical protein [Methyloceanibacter sp.]HML93405.1 hypothetical protein [Methyloceanibacter sp.]